MKIVVDVDDMWTVPIGHPNYQAFKDARIGELTEEHIKLADIVICTTLRLQDKVRLLNKNTVVIPNALPFDRDQYTVGDRVRGREISGNDKLRFMYLAGATHKKDVELLEGKFTRIGSEPFIKDNAQFILCGYNEVEHRMYKTQKDLEAKNDNYTTKRVAGDYKYMADVFRKTNSFIIYPSVDLEHYLNYYDSADCAIAPLQANEWNSYKSPLKIIEAGVKHVPIMLSAVAPYTDISEFKNEGIMYVETQDDWLKHIRFAVKNPDWLKDQGERLYEWTKEEYELTKWNITRRQVFESLVKV
jgi:hypothetical protein